MPRNLTFDSRNSCCIPYDNPPPGLAAQLQRLVAEERPGRRAETPMQGGIKP